MVDVGVVQSLECHFARYTRVALEPVAARLTAMPVNTVWVRPDKSRSIRRESWRSFGLLSTAPSMKTVVSAPKMRDSGRREATQSAFNAALCRTIMRGSAVGSSNSVTSGGITSKATPSLDKSSRRRGEAEARIKEVANSMVNHSLTRISGGVASLLALG